VVPPTPTPPFLADKFQPQHHAVTFTLTHKAKFMYSPSPKRDFLFLSLGLTHWAEKTQLVWTKIPDFLSMFPNGKAIYIIRDPRSVLASFKRFTNSQPPKYLGAVFNCLGSFQAALGYLENYPQMRYKLVRYEYLALNTEVVMDEVFAFLGVESPGNMLEKGSWTDAYGRSWTANTAFGEAASFSVPESVNRWQQNLTKAALFLCELVDGTDMGYFGYQPSGSCIAPSDFEDLLVALMKDEQISSFFSLWTKENTGIECFPSDPFDSKTWDDLKIRQSLENI